MSAAWRPGDMRLSLGGIRPRVLWVDRAAQLTLMAIGSFLFVCGFSSGWLSRAAVKTAPVVITLPAPSLLAPRPPACGKIEDGGF